MTPPPWADSPIHDMIREANLDNCEKTTSGPSNAKVCSAFRFSFSATYPKEHNRAGGTFLEGDLEVDDLDDLPHAALAIFQNAIADWDMTGQTEIRFSILPNANVDAPAHE